MNGKLGPSPQPESSFRFPKTSRILKRAEYKVPLDQGQKAVDSYLVLVAVRSPLAKARLGMVVSRKVGNAVVRNRIKRSLREHFRQVQQALPPLDLVIIARPAARELTTVQLWTSFDRCLGRLLKKL